MSEGVGVWVCVGVGVWVWVWVWMWVSGCVGEWVLLLLLVRWRVWSLF